MKPENGLEAVVMAYYKGAARLGNQRGRKRSAAAKSARGIPPSLDLPMPLKSGHAAVLHDTGVTYNVTVMKEMEEVQDEVMALADLERFVRHNGREYVRLKTPVLTRLHLPRPNGHTVRALCATEDMGCSGVRIYLPSRMDLKPGVPLDLDLFVSKRADPVAVRGIVSKISHTCDEELARCAVEIRFGPLKAETLQRIAEYVRSQTEAATQLPA